MGVPLTGRSSKQTNKKFFCLNIVWMANLQFQNLITQRLNKGCQRVKLVYKPLRYNKLKKFKTRFCKY